MAKSSAIALMQAEARTRIASAQRRARTSSLENALVRKAAGVTAAALYGTFNRMAVPVALGGFPWKLGVIALAQLGEGLTRGSMQAALAGIADATTAIYVERSITTDTLVAGGETQGGEL